MIYTAWVANGEVTFGPEHQVEDEDVFEFEITHNEGDFAALLLDIKNPRIGLLNPGRQLWLYLSVSSDTTEGDAIPLFLGRLVGVPEQLQGEVVRLSFTARPADYDEQKEALADSLRVLPYYDPVWISEDRRADPDAVLEGYSALWHIDRVTHEVSISAMLGPEDGFLELDGDFLRDSLDITYMATPATRIHIEAEVSWTQVGIGLVDITKELIAAFKAAGTTKKFMISSYTGEGLMNDWVEEGDRVGGGWSVGPTSVARQDGIIVDQEYETIVLLGGNAAKFPLFNMKASLQMRYDIDRKFSEKVVFDIVAGVQPLLTEPGEDDDILLTVSGSVDDLIDDATTDFPDGRMPIRDQRNRSYFNTARGRQSLDNLIAIGRANLLSRSRAVLIRFETSFMNGVSLSCRKGVTINDARIPGGTASGKITGYRLSRSGDSGKNICEITIGCAIGNGDTIEVVDGEPTYVVEGYVDVGYQFYNGQTIMPIAGEITYEDFSDQLPNDDGINFFDLKPVDVIEELVVINGVTIQRAVLRLYEGDFGFAGYFDTRAAAEAVNKVFTEVDLTMKKLDTGPFETVYNLTVSELSVPKTIDLEAAAS